MKVYDVYNNGNKLETYGYIHADDMYGRYLGHLIEYRGMIYEVVTDMNDVLLDPTGIPVLISPDMKTLINDIEIKKETMPEVIVNYDYDDKSNENTDDLVIDSGLIYYKGNIIKPID